VSGGLVLLTVWCGQCQDEKRPDRGKLGVIERTPKGAIRWDVNAKRLARLNRPGHWRGWRGGVVLEHPAYSHLDVPDRLVAICPHHGRGYIRTTEVVAQRGSLTLKMFVGG
jgi:hypothetical protein